MSAVSVVLGFDSVEEDQGGFIFNEVRCKEEAGGRVV